MSNREVIVPLRALPAPRDTLARPMRDLRISVMDRCNFRCPYCMPGETYHDKYRFLGSHQRLSFDEIVRVARLFVALGAPDTVNPPLTHFMPVRIEQDDWGRPWAIPAPTNGSGDFTALAGTDGFVELPPGPNTYKKGFVTRLLRWS